MYICRWQASAHESVANVTITSFVPSFAVPNTPRSLQDPAKFSGHGLKVINEELPWWRYAANYKLTARRECGQSGHRIGES
jgi:hypothetical protein